MASCKKSASIKVFNDDDVVQHILSGGDQSTGPKTRKKQDLEYRLSRKKDVYEENDSEEDVEENFDTTPNKFYKQDGEREVADADCLYGKDVFKFKSSKKAGQMAMKAQSMAASPQTPQKKVQAQEQAIPVRNGKAAVAVATPNTPKRTPSRRSKSGALTPILQRLAGPALRDHQKAELSTPYRLRKRNVVTDTNGGAASSESDDSVGASSSEEEEEEMNVARNGQTKEQDPKSTDSNLMSSAEAYFDLHSMNPVTSDRTLAGLDTPRMDVQAIRQVLKDVRPSHMAETSRLLEKHKDLFDRWMFNMCEGWNILTFGVGSKRSLLESFRLSHLKPFSHLVVNGYFPSLTVKHILNSITAEILEDPKPFTNLFSHLEFIEEYFKSHDEDFYLVIHNIDGVLLRSHKAQNVLSLLGAVPGIHLVASVDHINASFLWDEIQFFRFQWLWYDTPTFMSYEAENSYENSLMVQQSGGLALSSLVHVMRSLTPNAKRIFLTLAEHQLTAAEAPGYEGMSFQALYQKCREDFLVNSDLTLQAQLVEFKDHRLIRAKKNFEGVEHLLIPIDKATLKVFVEEQREAKS